jgi:RNA polymerase sigma factor for flagellar operon FliA
VAHQDGFEATFLRLLPRIERQCRFIAIRYGLATDVDDFTSHVKLRLIEDDYAILQKFQGRAQIETFVASVIQNLARDYRISRAGKWRPTAVARRLGDVAVLLERLMYRDGYSLEQAAEIIATNHRQRIAPADLEAIARQLPPRSVRLFVSDDVLETVGAPGHAPDDRLVAEEHRSEAARVCAALRDVKATLSDTDRVILAMRYEDGRKIVDIAGALHLDQKLLYRRIDALHASLKRELEARGITPDALAWFEAQQ